MSWTAARYAMAWDAGVLEGERVELLEGEIVRMPPIGPWLATTTPRLIRSLPAHDVVLYQGTLPAGPASVPDPDLFVLSSTAQPARALGQRLVAWDPADVLLVVEVSDTSLSNDLTIKAAIYAAAGCPTYWVISPDAVTVFSQPGSSGYAERAEFTAGDRLRVPYAPDVSLDVTRLLGG